MNTLIGDQLSDFIAVIENTGDTDLVFLEMFGKVDRYQDLSFSEWLAHTPAELVMAHL
jgi:oxalate decarboxylase